MPDRSALQKIIDIVESALAECREHDSDGSAKRDLEAFDEIVAVLQEAGLVM